MSKDRKSHIFVPRVVIMALAMVLGVFIGIAAPSPAFGGPRRTAEVVRLYDFEFENNTVVRGVHWKNRINDATRSGGSSSDAWVNAVNLRDYDNEQMTAYWQDLGGGGREYIWEWIINGVSSQRTVVGSLPKGNYGAFMYSNPIPGQTDYEWTLEGGGRFFYQRFPQRSFEIVVHYQSRDTSMNVLSLPTTEFWGLEYRDTSNVWRTFPGTTQTIDTDSAYKICLLFNNYFSITINSGICVPALPEQ